MQMPRVEPAPSTRAPQREPRRWREGKVRPIPGNSPHDRPVSRGILSSLEESLRRCLPRHRFRQLQEQYRAPGMRFLRHVRNLSGPMWFEGQDQTQTPGRDRAASRRSAPGPGSRTCREDHAPSHRPQMSSGRLFLDRVGRHQSPSPLHRRTQHNTHFPDGQEKGTFLLCWRG